ncbi:MAG: hypothetical protein AB8B87_06140 [Granulosicoccus sp.]
MPSENNKPNIDKVALLDTNSQRAYANTRSEEPSACSYHVVDQTRQRIATSVSLHELTEARIQASLQKLSEVKPTLDRYKESALLFGVPLSHRASVRSFYEVAGSNLEFDENNNIKNILNCDTRSLTTVSSLDQATHQDRVYDLPRQCSGDSQLKY